MILLVHSNRLLSIILIFFCSLLFFAKNTSAHEELSKGEAVYVSIYSSVHTGPKSHPFLLAALLSIRNTDPKYTITIHLADYFNTKGKTAPMQRMGRPDEIAAVALFLVTESSSYITGEAINVGGGLPLMSVGI